MKLKDLWNSWFGRTQTGTAMVKKDAGDTARPVSAQGMSLWGVIRESFTGAWQRNVTVEPLQNLLAFSAVYSCLALISNDISKLRPKLVYKKQLGKVDGDVLPD